MTNETLAARAQKLSRLYTLASQQGGSIRIDEQTGRVFFINAAQKEEQIGSSVGEATAYLAHVEQARAETA